MTVLTFGGQAYLSVAGCAELFDHAHVPDIAAVHEINHVAHCYVGQKLWYRNAAGGLQTNHILLCKKVNRVKCLLSVYCIDW